MDAGHLKYITLILVLSLLTGGILDGCTQGKTKPEVYVPKQWTSSDCIREIRQVWFLNLSSEDVQDTDRMKELIRVFWRAEAHGMTFQDIQKAIAGTDAMHTRTMTDILKNGL
jgi:hypothetical protein